LVDFRTDACRFLLFASANIVATTASSALDHIFPPRDVFRQRCWKLWFWSICSVGLLVSLLLVVALFVGMLANGGRLSTDVPRDQLERFRSLTGLIVGVDGGAAARKPPAENAKGPDEPGTNDGAQEEAAGGAAAGEDAPSKMVHVAVEEAGILPAVWRSRDAWFGPGLAWLFRNVEWLQSNVLATIFLLVSGAVLFVARLWCLSNFRSSCHHVALEAVAPTRRNLHRQAIRLGAEDLDGSRLATAEKLFVTEVEAVRRNLGTWLGREIRFPLELAALAIVVLSVQPILAVQCLLLLSVAWFVLESERRRSEGIHRLASDRVEAELRRQAEGFRSARLVRGFGVDQVEHDQFASDMLKFHDLACQQDRSDERLAYPRLGIVAGLSLCGAFVLFVLTTHLLLRSDSLSMAGGVAFVSAWWMAIPGIRALSARSSVRSSAAAAADKIQRYLDLIPSVSQAVGAKFLQPLVKRLHFDSITYRTPSDRLLLDGLDLTLEAGRTYSLVSLDPLESRALAAMLPRFIEPQRGRVLFDGEDIAWATLESLRAETIFVSGNDPLLPGTAFDNIRAGQTQYTLQQATDAAKISHAHNFIVKLFDGYDSVLTECVDQQGVSQRLRLSLARAMIRNPALLIIEEPQEALDEDTKALLSDAYDRICRGRTVIFLPGRLSTVRRSDEVIVIHEGRVAALGPQSKLVSQSPVYRHWEYLNFNEFRHDVAKEEG
jgi:ATP-binding cassette, subfamily B, bacterial